MSINVIMPQMGESVFEATVSKWLKKEGDAVKEFEPIMEVTTDKVDTEIAASASGVLLKAYVPEGVTVKVGTLLAVIGQMGEAVTADTTPTPSPPHPHTPQPPTSNVQSPTSALQKDLGFISPVVAKLASEHGVNLSQLKGTGLGGRITKKDVLAFVESGKSTPTLPHPHTPSPPPHTLAPTPGTTFPLNPMRKSIAEHMVRSKHTSPHVTTVFEADMSKAIAHREANKAIFARDGVNLTFTAYFVAASVAALKAFPLVNSSFAEDKILLRKEVNIGVAVSLGEEGLIVPVIKHADDKSLLALARELNDLANRARSKQLKPDEVQGGTFTITNHGVSGSLFATPIINQPQCGILGVGAIQKRVVVIGDAIAIRPMVYISLTFDHRIIDGAIADYFVAKVKEGLEGWG